MTNQAPRKDGTFQTIDAAECMTLLASTAVGRVAFDSGDGIAVYPVNHVVHDGQVYFRTSPYAAIVSALLHTGRASFEVDEVDEFLRSGWSVLVQGTAELVDPHEALVSLPSTEHPEPWAAGTRTVTVKITPHQISGRRVLPT